MRQRQDFPGPIQLAKEIADWYRRYLGTTFHFRDPALRRSFRDALAHEGNLMHGPYLEAAPVYLRGAKYGELLRDLVGPAIEPAFVDALNPNRRAYVHQEQAIRAAHEQRNVVVATGTGSGKTEAYLYPILLALLAEQQAASRKSGIRALVLYPMNALAEDQRQRLGRIALSLLDRQSRFAFTFGRYTGETPKDERDSGRRASQHLQDRLPGELVLRSEMRAQPPDILLTNYSMLEYLLLRPDDSPLFDGRAGASWRYLVLDEAHQYRGTKGLEMGMLLRRLKDRLRRGGLERALRCIATSASLGGDEDRPALARFASDLFGEDFSPDGIVLGKRATPQAPGSSAVPSTIWVALHDAVEGGNAAEIRKFTEAAAASLGLDLADTQDEQARVYRVLAHDLRVAALRSRIEERAAAADTLAGEVFGGDAGGRDPRRVLEAIAALAVWAREPEPGSAPVERAPFLNVRYHVFLKALEGAFVSLHPTPTVRLERTAASPDSGDEGALFEVGLCRQCGQHYFVGRRSSNGKLVEAIRDAGDEGFSVSFYRPTDLEDEADDDRPRDTARLCLVCGAITRNSPTPDEPACGHGRSVSVVEESARDSADDQVRVCGACRYRGPDPVREILHGTDGPSAVVATALLANLPKSRRKVLAFADGRQEAAYFPCYLEATHGAVRDRTLLLGVSRALAARGQVQEFSLKTLAHEVAGALREHRLVEESKSDLDVRREAWKLVLREYLSDEHRLSLEGVGLVAWTPAFPSGLDDLDCLRRPPWEFTDAEGRDILGWLLDTLRRDCAVEVESEGQVSLDWDEIALHSKQTRAGIGRPEQRPNFKSWDGERTRRVSFLCRLMPREARAALGETGVRAAAQTLLRSVWEGLRPPDGEAGLLQRGADDGYRARSVWWRMRPLDRKARLFRCGVCGRVQPRSIRDVCERHGCPGTLDTTSVEEVVTSNHYGLLYESEGFPMTLRAEEHTAQLEPSKAREFQSAFASGKIQVLSSSTTFELGVDLGDLDAIFLRNVPPEPFNYAQRVGRAGRRVGQPGFAVTYCRRRPHDFVHFQDPARMIAGKATPPRLHWTNDKIALRHVTAVVLAAFFQRNAARFKDVLAFAGALENPTIVADVRTGALATKAEFTAMLRDIVPPPLADRVGLIDGTWIERILGQGSRLVDAVLEASSDYVKVRAFEEESSRARRHADARWAKERADTMAQENVISFLSRKVVIPKYGFPVDVVELDLHRRRAGARSREVFEVSLERDLAIAVAEFAPGSQVVANKKVWTSFGLKRVVGKEWDRKQYAICPAHGFRSWAAVGETPTRCCGNMKQSEYIDPIFGFVTDRLKKPDEPRLKPARQYTTRPHFVRSEHEMPPIMLGNVAKLWKVSPGRLVVLCEGQKGQGFVVCPDCGAGARARGKARDHKTPMGSPCSGRGHPVALGHEFITDVLRVAFTIEPSLPDGASRPWFPHSLAFALYHGAAEVVEVPASDLSVTVRPRSEGIGLPEIVLYDNVPGGAGLVAELEDPAVFRRVLEESAARVAGGCGCAPSTSCYGCLRGYTNQFAHPHLTRGPVHEYLLQVLENWRP